MSMVEVVPVLAMLVVLPFPPVKVLVPIGPATAPALEINIHHT